MFRLLRHLVGYAWREFRSFVAMQWAMYLVQALAPGAVVYVTSLTVDAVSRTAAGDVTAWRQAAGLILVGLGVTVASTLLGLANRIVESYFQETATIATQSELFAKVERLPLEFFEQAQSHDLVQRASNGAGGRFVAVSGSLARVAGSFVTITTYLALLVRAHWALAAGLAPILAAAMWANLRWGQQRFWLYLSQTTAHREMSYLSSLLTGQLVAKELRVFGIGAYLREKWRRVSLRVREENVKLSWRQGLARTGLVASVGGASAAASLALLSLTVNRRLTLGAYVALGGAVSGALNESSNLASIVSQAFEQALFLRDYFQLLEMPERRRQGEREFPQPLRVAIQAADLTFTYPEAARPAIEHVSFEVAAGERVAIVGENGSGKTTLVKCLLGLYEPSNGVVLFDGVELKEISPASLQLNTTAVFQDFGRFALKARENVGFGDVSKIGDDSALAQAAVSAGGTSIIDELPQGWDTPLSRMWPGGVDLSYGQWQRVAIARAFLRDAQLVVLDEPTAALDPRAETEFLERLAAVMTGRTAFFVSHRLGMARIADRILVLKHGRLVENGTHAELLSKGGEYARLYRSQAKWYHDPSPDDLARSHFG